MRPIIFKQQRGYKPVVSALAIADILASQRCVYLHKVNIYYSSTLIPTEICASGLNASAATANLFRSMHRRHIPCRENIVKATGM